MQHWYEWQGCELVYLPLHELASVEWESTQEYLTYKYPVLNSPEFREVLGTLREPAHMLINRMLVKTSLETTAGEAFLLYTDESLQKDANPYKVLATFIPGNGYVEQFFQSGFERLWNRISVVLPEIYSSENTDLEAFSLRRFDEPELSPHFNLQKSNSKSSNKLIRIQEPDESVPILSEDLALHIESLLRIGDRSRILDVVVHLLNNLNPYLKATPAGVLKMLEKHWAEYAVAGRSSRIFIDKHCRLFLTDFGNNEIIMRPLPKTLFLFYLNHPEGIAFPYLSDHRQELDSIYASITRSSNTEEIRASINNLVDMTNNSINENCSRIKEAFLRGMDASVAAPYLVSGPRGGLKKIGLDRSLVTWESGTMTRLSELG